MKIPAALLTVAFASFLVGFNANGAETAPSAAASGKSSFAAGGPAAPDCASANSHVAWRECAVLERDRADAALKQQFQTTLNRLRQVTEEDFAIAKAQGFGDEEYRRHLTTYVQSLERSQQAWMTYRREYCHADSFPGRNGNSNLENFIGCELPLIKARIEQLQTLTKELQSDG